MKWTILAVCLGFLIDLLIGDPRWLYHPVRVMGNCITLTEKGLRRIFPKNKSGERTAGVLLVIIIAGVSTLIPCLLLRFAYGYRLWLGVLLETVMCYQLVATKALKDESMKVYSELKREDLKAARDAVAMIVGRDTKQLSNEEVTRATVETIAENASDGVIAPLFYLMLGGAAAGFFYKAVNTMDSMVGYKNEKYQWFGTFAAVLDDVVNYIPARISGVLLILAAAFCGYDSKNAAKIFIRDREKHSSPNAAQTEAAMAGALRIQLAGNASYFGELQEKPVIGDAIKPIANDDIKKANKILYAAAAAAVVIFGIARLLLIRITGLF